LPAPLDTSAYKPLKATRLQTLAESKKGHDYAPYQMQFLKWYEIPGDRQIAWIQDTGISAVEAPRNELYIQEIIDRLLGCWPGPRPPIHAIISSSGTYRAHAYGSGVIEFSAPLIASLGSTDALAFTIAHEIGHILAEDEARRNNLSDTIQKIVDSVGSAVTVAREARFEHAGNTVGFRMRPRFGSANVLTASYGVDALTLDLVTPNFEAQQEFDADAFALDMMVCAHFNPQAGSTAAIMTLSKGEALNTTHLERVAAISGKLIADVEAPVKSGDAVSQLKNQAVQVATTATMKAALKAASQIVDKRKSPEARAKALQKYADRTYGGLPIIAMAEEDPNIASVLKDQDWTTLVANARLVGETMEQVDQAGFDGLEALADAGSSNASSGTAEGSSASTTAAKADAEARAKLAPLRAKLTPDSRISEGYHLAGVLAEAADDKPSMQRYWQEGVKSRWASREMIEHLAESYVEAGQPANAATVLAIGRARVGDLPSFLPIDLLISAQANHAADAEVIAAHCLSKGGSKLYVECVAPLGYDPACSPRTPEGKKAFDVAKMGVSVKRFSALPELLDPQTGKASGRYLQCLS
jgi:predicted Zn-dependent protease